MIGIAVWILAVTGTAFMLVAAVGLVRLPDLYMRLSACTKAATLGVGSLLIAAALWFDDFGVTCRALAAMLFIFITAPVAGHMIGRAAYISGVPLWESTVIDELRDQPFARLEPSDAGEDESSIT